jgi:hypothetical protein
MTANNSSNPSKFTDLISKVKQRPDVADSGLTFAVQMLIGMSTMLP